MEGPLSQLREAVQAASGAVAGGNGGPRVAPTLERPKQAGFGDYATNAAMLLAPVAGKPPRDVAAQLAEELQSRLGLALDRVEVAGPGFLNLFLSDGWCATALGHVLAAGGRFAGGGANPPERVNVEFVSANPTGPLTAASGRHASYGDSLARLLEFQGHEVSREYYINDVGSQIRRLGESIAARARGDEVAEDGYQGDYVFELARRIPNAGSDPVEVVGERGVMLLLQKIQASMHAMHIDFDVWFSEGSLHEGEPTPVAHALEQLEQRGETYYKDGALWWRTTAHGDDRDRVLERSTGEHTYFTSDLAYYLDKRERGFDRLIYVLGADHHGYVPRMKSMPAAWGHDADTFEVPIMQFVNLIERGERTGMSKRRGEFVTLDELVAKIGVDAVRFLMLQRSHDTPLDLDLDLAVAESKENPVYYVQYAHARIVSVLRKAARGEIEAALAEPSAVAHELEPAERAVVMKLLAFPEVVAEATERRAPHRIAAYALELAQVYTRFYDDCPVLKADDHVRPFRLRLSVASQRTIARALQLLGVSAPESM
ncbi:MAG: arginyl-tRNA synthetase [Solirubrobacteraceae bacterium]|jgi:arginyl-tRNA synthetase|nr:arginyl-tRNA synthetase [Solirubrobacteraceae bacterium]